MSDVVADLNRLLQFALFNKYFWLRFVSVTAATENQTT